MKKEIKIFKSFEEQEKYHLELMSKTSPLERFKSLLEMQQWSLLVHPKKNDPRKISILKNGHS